MAEIAVSLATKQAVGLLEKLGSTLYSKISKEFSLLLGVREEIEFIRDELQIMSAFLRSAEEMDIKLAARAWVNQVKEIAYAVEDCLEDFTLHLSHYGNSTFWSRALQTAGSLNDRRRIAAIIHSTKNRVKEVSERRLRYGITTEDRALTSSDYEFDPRSAALFVEESQLVGLEGPRDKLVALLREEERPQLTLIAVVGEGGLGKTTIVRKAYESPDIAGSHFACRAWITVSQVYNTRDLLRQMIKQLIPEPPQEDRDTKKSEEQHIPEPPQQDLASKEQNLRKYEEHLAKMNESSLTQMIKDHLKHKRYVIVFDDIWDINAWKSLRLGLPNSNCLSRIMITTRNINLAEACLADTSGHVYRHEKLTEQQSMDLFCKRVFSNDDPEQHNTCPEYLKEVTQDILRKCDGLPLAVVSIAGVLATKLKKKKTMRATGHEQETLEEWRNLLKHLGSELESNPSLRGLNQVIIFSYNDLPYHIKRCYLYLTKFPEDSLIKRKHIIRLWIAEGFVGTRKDMTAEEVAESYFDELVNRCMILPSLFDAKGKVKSFRVHDVMLQVMTSKSMEETFLCVLQNKNKWTAAAAAGGGDVVIRRLAVLGEGEHQQQEEHSVDPMSAVGSLSRVRSLTISDGGSSSFISPEMGFLRVLDLKGCKSIRGKHLKVICKLLHLKYLNLEGTQISGRKYPLPKSIGNLRRLETLITKGSCIKKLPIEVLKLRQLQFLSINSWQADNQLLSMIGRLTNLRKLKGFNVQSNLFHRLKLRFPAQLRELSLVCRRYDGIKLCKSLEGISSSLRSLKMFGLWPIRSIWSTPFHLKYLESIPGLSFLNKWSIHFPELECLSLNGQLGTLPTWISRCTKLLKITLGWSDIEVDDLKSLGDLPNLLTLNLFYGVLREDKISFSAQEFKSLRVLLLSTPISVIFEREALPSLEVLTLDYNYDPSEFSAGGIKYLNSLKKIVLYKPDEEGLEGMKKALDEHPNHPHLTVQR